MREIFRLNNSQTRQGKDILIVARNQAGKVSYDQLNRDYMKLLRYHGLLIEESKWVKYAEKSYDRNDQILSEVFEPFKGLYSL